jgi:sulfite reductase (NADPH) flavoprotein alpha-component
VVIKERYALTQKDSTKQVFHVSLDLQNAPLAFKVGDSIGIFPQNDPVEVEQLIAALHAQGDETIADPRSNETMSFHHFLTFKVNLSRLTSGLIKLFAQTTPNAELQTLLLAENKPQLTQYLNTHEIIDFLHAHPDVRMDTQELCAHFSPLLPRFYSVASSPSSIPGEVHLTVALTKYTQRDRTRYGVASHFLCHLAQENHTPVPLYVQPAHHFTLPADDTIPIIMVGPGTGVAPFRAFMQERMHRSSPGKNWLFFGDRHRMSDYYYQEFWEDLSAKGILKLHTAFSRDQEHKIYVQHMMQSHAQELFAWLEAGAHFYVCGDAQRMAKDVEAMLHTIVQEQGNMTPENAKAYVKSLRATKRYLADVY